MSLKQQSRTRPSIHDWIQDSLLIVQSLKQGHEEGRLLKAFDTPDLAPKGSAEIAYQSPEFRQEIDNPIDQRSDIYSLGMVLYHMLSGRHPMLFDDQSASLLFDPSHPEVIQEILTKMTNYFPEDRYQSLQGILSDLKRCELALQTQGQLDFFVPGQADIPQALVYSKHLYDRYGELERIQELLSDHSTHTQLLMVKGYAGIGKTSLINTAIQNVQRLDPQALVLSGKYEQTVNEPYAAIKQMLQAWVKEVSSNPDSMDYWKQVLPDALAPNAQLLVDLVPNLESLIGTQSSVATIDPDKIQYRLFLTLKKWIDTIVSKQERCILFLDDLQWADRHSLTWLSQVLQSLDNGSLFIVAAYRDHDFLPDTHFEDFLSTVCAPLTQNGTIKSLSLSGISQESLELQLEDLLHCEELESKTLAALIYEKTLGNPFFTQQLLRVLEEKKQLRFNSEKQKWEFEVQDIQSVDLSDNVVDIAIQRIDTLADELKTMLSFAACMGNKFSAKDLELCLPNDTLSFYIRRAIQKQFIQQLGAKKYTFAHDRIQEASLRLYSKSRLDEIRYTIASKLLERHQKSNELSLKLPIIATQLSLISDDTLIQNNSALVETLLLVAKRYRLEGAYTDALPFYERYLALSPPLDWNQDYEALSDIYLAQAECLYLCGNVDASKAIFGTLHARSKTQAQKLEVVAAEIKLLNHDNQADVAIQFAFKALKELKVWIPRKRLLPVAILWQAIRIRSHIKRHGTSSLQSLPMSQDPYHHSYVKLAVVSSAPFYLWDPQYFVYIVSTVALLTLKKGHTPDSPGIFSAVAFIIAVIFKDYKMAAEISKVAEKIDPSIYSYHALARAKFTTALFISHWVKPLPEVITELDHATQWQQDVGDHVFEGYARGTGLYLRMYAGHSIDSLLPRIQDTRQRATAVHDKYALESVLVIQTYLNVLQGTQATDSFATLEVSNKTSLEFVQSYFQISIDYLFSEAAISKASIRHAEQQLQYGINLIMYAQATFFIGLSLIRNLAVTPSYRAPLCRCKIKDIIKKFRYWSDHCPNNFEYCLYLLEAELATLKNQWEMAKLLYIAAIQSAKDNKNTQILAMASEGYAKYYLKKGNTEKYIEKLSIAKGHYENWGAMAKAQQIEDQVLAKKS